MVRIILWFELAFIYAGRKLVFRTARQARHGKAENCGTGTSSAGFREPFSGFTAPQDKWRELKGADADTFRELKSIKSLID